MIQKKVELLRASRVTSTVACAGLYLFYSNDVSFSKILVFLKAFVPCGGGAQAPATVCICIWALLEVTTVVVPGAPGIG